MPEFTVGGNTYDLQRYRKRDEQVAAQARTFGDTLVSSRQTANSTVPVYECEVGYLTESETNTLLGDLKAVGTVDIAGDEIGSTVTCHARDIGWVSDLDENTKRVTFVAEKVDP